MKTGASRRFDGRVWGVFCLAVVVCTLGSGVAFAGQMARLAAPLVTPPVIIDASFADTYDPSQGPYGGSNVGPAPTFMTGAPMPNLVEPTGLGSNVGEVLYDGVGNSTITGNIHCDKFLVSNYHVVHISGDVTILVEEEFKVANHTRIELMPGATLKIYVKKDAIVQDQAALNPDTANPFAVTIYNLGVRAFKVQNQSNVCATMFSPDKFLQVQDGSNFYGYFVGTSLHLQNNAGFHFGLGSGLEPLAPLYD